MKMLPISCLGILVSTDINNAVLKRTANSFEVPP